jgi:serine/threonine-protein kinase HipA
MAGSRRLRVFLDGIPIGHAEQSPQGQLSFTYDEEYRHDPEATPLSLSMPLTGSKHGNKQVRAYLDGLLPDSQPARERWGRQYGVSPNNPFTLLAHVGRDAAGAVQILPPDAESSDAAARAGDIEWLSVDEFATMAHDLAEHGEDWDPGRFGGRWSLAGAQPKIALFRDPSTGEWGIPRDSTPTNCIVKPVLRQFERHHVNEALCLRAADEAGLLAAEADLVEVADVQAIISHRYDRTEDADGRWLRVTRKTCARPLQSTPAGSTRRTAARVSPTSGVCSRGCRSTTAPSLPSGSSRASPSTYSSAGPTPTRRTTRWSSSGTGHRSPPSTASPRPPATRSSNGWARR